MSSSLLAGLNAAQQRAVQADDGPVLVLAGPGSGKTRVLTHRVAYLIGDRAVDPYNIVAVTFTNKAARELKERLQTLVGPQGETLTVGTFHSICARWLRRDIHHLGRERDFAIYDTDDQLRVMKRVLTELNLDEKKNPPRAILAAISSAKNELISIDKLNERARTYYDEMVVRCFTHYQKLLAEANALDFDDLLVEMVRLFEEHPAVLEYYHKRFLYILADEYQDTNHVQYVLLKLLARRFRNLFVVGDEDQSVYAFRGADIRNIRSFEGDYPEAQVILLEQNYRSTQSILNVAQAVINRSASRARKKDLWTQNAEGTLVAIQEGFDQDEEAQLVAAEAARLIESGEFRPQHIAVMYRTNAQSRAVEEALIGRGLPYQIVGGTRFYERKEVKDALAYLRLARNPFDTVSFGRVLNWPGRGIGQRTEDELYRWSAAQGIPPYVALQLLAGANDVPLESPSPFNARTTNALVGFLQLLDDHIAAADKHDLGALIDRIYMRVGFEGALTREYGEEEGRERWANLGELRSVAENYVHFPQEEQLGTFLEEVALVADLDSVKEERDTLTCITLHQAKGLEYPVVFLIGLEEGVLPHSRSLDDGDALDEERRLFYVGATRAQQRLYLLYAAQRTSYGRTNVAAPSRFLKDIPTDLVNQMPRRGYAARQTSMFTNRSTFGTRRIEPVRRQPPAPRQQQADLPGRTVAFFAGQHVRHATFGEGIVVSTKLVENDEEVTVAFSGKGVKRLLASFANLQIAE